MRVITTIALAVFAVELLRTAWVCDDSYITFRTADNIVHGFGPVWNTTERVQGFTHPLWLAVFTGAYAITSEAYYTAISLGVLLSLGAMLFLSRRIARTPWSLVLASVVLVSSKAWVDFSTSGLENPLSHVLVLVFLWCWWNDQTDHVRLRRLALVASLVMLTRIDLGLLVGPALAVEVWRVGPAAAWRPLAIGFAPFAAWELFSVFYYASLVPNTAYAKLNVSMSEGEALAKGLAYFKRTAIADPATLPAMLIAVAATVWTRWRRDWPLVAGLIISLAYVLWIGGDFMAGRFFTVPLIWCAALLAVTVSWSARVSAILTTTVLVIGLTAPWEPALLSGIGYARVDNRLRGRLERAPRDGGLLITINEITDVRRYYYEGTGLLKGRLGDRRPDDPGVDDGVALRASGRQVVLRDGIGFTGYFAGPQPHIVDVFALTDPLLARLPAIPGSRIGHFRRDIPAGYLESLEQNTVRIDDPDLADYYTTLRFAVSGPLFDARRAVTAVGLATGRYNASLRRYVSQGRPRDE